MRDSRLISTFFLAPHNITSVIFLIFSTCQIAFSQETESERKNDSVYWISQSEKLSLYTYGITKLNTFELKNPQGKDLIRYRPNAKLSLGLGFNYSWLGIGTAFNFRFLDGNSEIYGKSQSFDIQGDIYSKKTIFSSSVQTYKGFYWENVTTYDTTWSKLDSVPLRPDIATLNIGVTGFYVKNSDKFSFKSVYTNTEWQKRSAGSLLYGGHISYYSLSADTFLIPGILWDSYPTYDSLVNLSTFSLGVSIGYAYTFVFFEKFYLHGTLLLGPGMQYAQGQDGNGQRVFVHGKPSMKSHFRFAFGVNNDDYYYGISLTTDTYPIRNEFESSFIYKYGKFRFFYGQHIDYKPRRKKKM